MAKWWKYFINPVGALIQDYNNATGKGKFLNMLTNPGDFALDTYNLIKNHGKKSVEGMVSNEIENLTGNPDPDMDSTLKTLYDDFTGKSQIELQNKLQRELAEEEYQRNLQAIGDTAAAYDAAGFNKNLLYSGASPASYSAPQLQAYSGSAKLDTILNRSAKVLGMIPALYQATASLEGIDQARERTKQSEIKTMAMGMDLINKGYNLGDKYFSRPYAFDLSNFHIPGRHFDPNNYGFDFVPESKHFTWHDTDGKAYEMFGKDVYKKYMDASLRNQFDLLESIGLGNSLRRTRNAYMGYQYDLDRRYGAAGRIVGMASQSLGAAAKLMPGMKYFFK